MEQLSNNFLEFANALDNSITEYAVLNSPIELDKENYEISIQTSQENILMLSMKSYYCAVRKIEELERYNDEGVITYDEYIKNITILLKQVENIHSDKFYQTLQVKELIKKYISDFKRALYRIEVMHPSPCNNKIRINEFIIKNNKIINEANNLNDDMLRLYLSKLYGFSQDIHTQEMNEITNQLEVMFVTFFLLDKDLPSRINESTFEIDEINRIIEVFIECMKD